MGKEDSTLSRYQLLCLGFLSLLSPIIRLLPGQAAEFSGSYAWVAGILAIIPVSLLFFLIGKYLNKALPKEGFGELFLRSLGKPAGKSVLLLLTLWLILYAAFALRSGADRYITATYENSSPAIFICIMLALALYAALGKFLTLARSAAAFLPLLVLVLGTVFVLAFQDIDWEFLPPPSVSDIPSILKGVPTIATVLGLSVYIGFLEGRVREKEKRSKTISIFLLLMVIVVVLLCLLTVGVFGAKLTAKLHYPFFTMVRNLSLFNIVERLEALVLAQWVITDFMLISTLMFIIVNNFGIIFGFSKIYSCGQKRLTFKNGRWCIWVSALVILVLALTIAPTSPILQKLSVLIVPAVNLVFVFGLLPLTIIVGLLRKRL